MGEQHLLKVLFQPQRALCCYLPWFLKSLQARKNVEGSLFVLKRKSAPRFRMIVLNKISTGVDLTQLSFLARVGLLVIAVLTPASVRRQLQRDDT